LERSGGGRSNSSRSERRAMWHTRARGSSIGGGAAIRFEERIVVVHGEGSGEEERHALIGRIKWRYLSGTVKQGRSFKYFHTETICGCWPAQGHYVTYLSMLDLMTRVCRLNKLALYSFDF
jgi:hypothetical protein